MAAGRHLENGYDVITPPTTVHYYEIWLAYEKCHADEYTL